MPSRLRIVRTSLNSDIEERAPFPVVEMVGFEPTMEAELTNGVIRFALSLRHISMYCRLSRCVKTRLTFTVFARGLTLYKLCRMAAPRFLILSAAVPNHLRKATRCLDTVIWSTSPSTIIPASPAAAVKNFFVNYSI